jgi:hypothetical protein
VEPLYRAIEAAEAGPNIPMMRETDTANPFSDNNRDPSVIATAVQYNAPRDVSIPETRVGHTLKRVETLPEYQCSEHEDDLYAVPDQPFPSEKTAAAAQQIESRGVEETSVDEAAAKTHAMGKSKEKDVNDVAGPHSF